MKLVRPPRPDRGAARPRRPSADNPAAAAGSSPADHRPRRNPPPRRRTGQPAAAERWIYGRHAVTAALANPERGWRRLAALAGHEAEARALVAGARAVRRGGGAPLRVLDRDALAALLPEGAVHQGLALEVEPLAGRGLDDLLRDARALSGRCVIVLLDQVSDPHNLGAVLRSAAAFGAFAVMLAEHGGAPVTGALAKAASGALEHVPLVKVVNLARALDRLKEAGFWICGLDESAAEPLAALDLGQRVALVLGGEGGGMRRLVREHCDYLARLPTLPAQPTLNVSNAAAIALYELARSSSIG
jgi:23S rRNA (guanosine2251-2'-O)-methyltransferase